MKHGPYINHEFGADAEAHYAKNGGWLTAACSASIAWPEEDVKVTYDGDDYFLRGVHDCGGHKSSPAITMRCALGDANNVLARLYRFVSVLGWFKGGYVEVGGYVTGSHAVLYGEPQSFFSILSGGQNSFNCNYMPLIRDERTRRALAFWREGARLRQLHTGYAFLSFFKVLESQFEKVDERVAWMNMTIPTLENKAGKRVKQLRQECADVGKHIYESGRCAVAHAQFSDGRGDPDVPEDRRRLSEDLAVIEGLAHRYITDVLQVPDENVVHCKRDRLELLTAFVPAKTFGTLRAAQFVSRRQVGLNGLVVGFAHWPRAPVPELCALTLRVIAVQNGCVHLHATNKSGSICIAFLFDFPSGLARVDLNGTRYREPKRGETPDAAIALVQFKKQVIANGLIEMWLQDGGRVDFEIVIPINIDFNATFRAMDYEVERLEAIRKTG